MVSAWNAYLDKAKAKLGGVSETSALDHSYATAVDSAINAWAVSLAELKETAQHETIQPSQQTAPQSPTERSSGGIEPRICADNGAAYRATTPKLERLADEVGQTKDYKLRTDYESGDEIGRLAVAFNAMLAELAAAREREAADAARRATMQIELARVARITTMGEMAASIAHEINQPLAAIVNNANASLRWLGRDPPNVERARSVLERVVSDGGRASAVIQQHSWDAGKRQPGASSA